MTKQERDELRKLLAYKTSETPLEACGHEVHGSNQLGPNPLGTWRAKCQWEVDADLFAAAVNALPELLAFAEFDDKGKYDALVNAAQARTDRAEGELADARAVISRLRAEALTAAEIYDAENRAKHDEIAKARRLNDWITRMIHALDSVQDWYGTEIGSLLDEMKVAVDD